MIRRLFFILALFLGALALEQDSFHNTPANQELAAITTPREQITLLRPHNIDIEHSSTLVVPSARSSTSNVSRQAQQRMLHLMMVENLRVTTKYHLTRFIILLGNSARSIDFYLYMLCQLRL